MSQIHDIESTRYDRLCMWYENMKSEQQKFKDMISNGVPLSVPIQVNYTKNAYTKYLRVPLVVADTKQYYIKIFEDLYRLYKKCGRYYFIDAPESVSKKKRDEAFFTCILESYVAVAIFELIKWLTSGRLKYKLMIDDYVYYPIFKQPQWSISDYDCRLLITRYPVSKTMIDDKTIPLSIFYDDDYESNSKPEFLRLKKY